MLDALELSQSPLLLKLLSGILCRDRKHIMEEQFHTCFQKIAKRLVKELIDHFVDPNLIYITFQLLTMSTGNKPEWERKACHAPPQEQTGIVFIVSTLSVFRCLIRSSSERQLQLLSTVYGVIQQGDVPVNSMLQAMMERVLLPLASHCSTKTLNDFFVANVSDIIALLLSRFTKVCSSTALHLRNYFKHIILCCNFIYELNTLLFLI